MKFDLSRARIEPRANAAVRSGTAFRSVTEAKTRRLRVHSHRAFTLIEVLASLLLMAIIIPVAMEGMSVASRAGILGQRKAAAMRVAERVLNELIVENETQHGSSSGSTLEGDTNYPWTMRSETWSEGSMLQLTVTVTFTVQGNAYEVSTSTLLTQPGTIPEEQLPAPSQ
jgi:prepilin-type N-terminal cleavage/methylation domain-containing protein